MNRVAIVVASFLAGVAAGGALVTLLTGALGGMPYHEPGCPGERRSE